MAEKFKNTPEQQAVLDVKNENIIVSAQAGAGKTRVLVQRILQFILEDKVSLENMLIVTFTKKAANEMKDRIRDGLLTSLDEEGADKVWIYTQLNNVASANIQTMHAFCLEVLQEHFDLLGRDPGFHVLNNKSLGQIQERALDDVISRIYQTEDPQLRSFIEVYGFTKRRDDNPLRELILKLYHIANNQTFPEEWLKSELQRMGSEEYNQDTQDLWFKEAIASSLIDFANSLQVYGHYLDNPLLVDKLEQLVDSDLATFNAVFFGSYVNYLKEDLSVDDLTKVSFDLMKKWQDLPDTVSLDRLPTIKAPKHSADEIILKDQVKEHRDDLKEEAKELIAAIKGLLEVDVQSENLLMRETLVILSDLAMLYKASYQAGKEEVNGIDFSDIEHDMVRLLERDSVVKELQDRYAYIFFDEYQDASGIQNYIVEKMSRKDNLLFVGDIKQSIYGFRLAEPKNFIARYQLYSEQGSGNQALDLTANFRSKPSILHFINFIFSPLMTETRGSIPFDTDTHRSNAKREDPNQEGGVHVVILEEKKDEEEGDDRPASSLDEISSQAFYVARKIQALVAQGHRYRDFAILFRTKHRIFQYERILDEFNIPYYSDSESFQETSTEVAVFIQLLRLIDNGRVDMTLLASLSSHAGSFSDEELGAIRVAYKSSSFHEAFYAYAEDKEAKDPNLQKKINEFLDELSNWRKLMKRMKLSDFIWTVLVDTGLYAFYSALKEGENRRENLNTIVRAAKEYEKQASASLFGFLSYLETDGGQSGEDLPTASDLSEEDNVVRLMTIHKSKGLEFPIVFLVEIEKEFSDLSARDIISSHSQLGLSIRRKYVDEDTGLIVKAYPIRQSLIRRINRREEIEEQMRVLYVAMTRAETKLYLIGQVNNMERLFFKPKGPNLEAKLDKGSSYMQWIMSILANDKILYDRVSYGDQIVITLPSHEDKYFDREGLASTKEQIHVLLAKGSDYRSIHYGQGEDEGAQKLGSQEDLVDILDFAYPYQDEVKYPIKNTVSEISRKNQILDDRFKDWPSYNGPNQWVREERKAPAFVEESRKLSPAEWGSRMHLAFQLLPIKTYDRDTLTQCLDSLVERELFTKEERDSLDEALILQFFQSSLGSDIINNKNSVQRELAFTIAHQIGEVKINIDGQIDLVYVKDDALYLVDFKTDLKPVAEKYKDQLYFYTEAIRRAYPNKKVETASLYWVRSGHITTFEADALHLAE